MCKFDSIYWNLDLKGFLTSFMLNEIHYTVVLQAMETRCFK